MRGAGVGGYCTNGCNCTAGNNGGECYGDCKLTFLHIESGARGECTKTEFGGTNGGPITTNCCSSLIVIVV